MVADLVIIGILLIGVIVGFARGFINTVLGFLSVFVALLVAYLFCRQFAAYLEGTQVFTFIQTKVMEVLSSNEMLATTTIPSVETLTAALSEKYPAFLVTVIVDTVAPYVGTNGDMTLAQILEPTISSLILNAVSFLILFLAALLLTLVIKSLGKAIAKLPLIRTVDKILGALLGGVFSLIIIYLGFLILGLLADNTSLAPVFSAIQESTVALYLYNNNILGELLNTVFTTVSPTTTPSPQS